MASITTSFEPTIAAQAFARKPNVWREKLSNWATPNAKRTWAGYAASVVVHLVAIGFAALISFTLPALDDRPELESAFIPDILPVDMQLDPVMPAAGDVSLDPGGRTLHGDAADGEESLAAVPNLAGPAGTNFSAFELAKAAWSQGDLLTPAGVAKRSTGKGSGQGDGEGNGSGFFGIPHNLGQRIVYIVDNSLSMNHKHDSPAKTRFKRVQVELVNSIWLMEPEQQFFVIFFNRDTAAMPARSMQQATLSAKEHYLTWVAETKTAGAPTDPRQAMELALGFEPDIIYFLTDGEFAKGVNRQLLKIKQSRTAIHTFAFGDKLSEEVLSDIAKNNQGKYTYIP